MDVESHLARRLGLVFACLAAVTNPSRAVDSPAFLVRKANGQEVRGPLVKVGSDWSIEVGKGLPRRLDGVEWLLLRQAGVALPAFPTDEHVVLTSGDRIPARGLRVDDEKLHFRHVDLNGGKEAVVPLSAVAMVWRLAPDGTVAPARLRHQLLRTKKKRDQLLLRNGDRIEGTLNRVTAEQAELEVGRKNVSTKWPQVSAVILSADLADKRRPKGLLGRVVLSSTDRSPGGRITVVSPSCDGTTFRARTTFGATLSVPIDRVVAVELTGDHGVHLGDLTPSKYVFTPYLDEVWPWTADANVRGNDLTLGGSAYDRGVGMHARSRLTYALGGKYRRFDALVGLDDLDGRKGRVRVRVLIDGEPADLGRTELSRADGGVRISLGLVDAKELTLEVNYAGEGPIQAVVNWVEARLVR